MSYIGLDAFYEQAANGTLPMISYIVGPTELSEHPPYSPHDGAWLQQQVVNAVTKGKNWNSTALKSVMTRAVVGAIMSLLTTL